MNTELWGKNIIKAKALIVNKSFADAKIILEQLLKHNNEECVIDAKKLLVEISLIEKNNFNQLELLERVEFTNTRSIGEL